MKKKGEDGVSLLEGSKGFGGAPREKREKEDKTKKSERENRKEKEKKRETKRKKKMKNPNQWSFLVVGGSEG